MASTAEKAAEKPERDDFNVSVFCAVDCFGVKYSCVLRQITSELWNVMKNRKREAQFIEHLQKRYCMENYEVWARTTELLELIRNQGTCRRCVCYACLGCG